MAAASPGTDLVRGDANDDGQVDMTDALTGLNFLFIDGAPEPTCLEAGDANDDGELDIADPIYLLFFVFINSNQPSPPFPDCGPDPSGDLIQCLSTAHCDQTETDGDGFSDGEEVLPCGVPGLPDGQGNPTAFVIQEIEGVDPLGSPVDLPVLFPDHWVKFENFKADPANFDPSRFNVFHYCIWAHRIREGSITTGISRSGSSANIPCDEFLYTDDFIVAIDDATYNHRR